MSRTNTHSLLKKVTESLFCVLIAITLAVIPNSSIAQADTLNAESNDPCTAVGSTISWTIQQEINALGVNAFNRYTAMEFTDYLPEGTEYAGMKVICEANQDVTEAAGESAYSTIQNCVKYRFNDKWLASSMSMIGETYTFIVYARITSIPKDETYQNKSTIRINNLVMKANETATKIQRPVMEVEFEPEGYIVASSAGGDVADYTVRITQTEPGAALKNVQVRDIIPEGMEFISDSIHAEDKNGNPIEITTNETEEGFTATVDRLDCGESAIVSFQCMITSTNPGECLENVIEATAGGVEEPRSFTQSVYICDNKLTRNLTIDKCIHASDLNTGGKDIAFMYRIVCDDFDGNNHTYRTVADFSGTPYIDEEGFAHYTCELKDLPAGMYTITEISPLRFPSSEISSDDTNVSIEESCASANLITQESARCSFKSPEAYSKNPTCTVCMINEFPGGSK